MYKPPEESRSPQEALGCGGARIASELSVGWQQASAIVQVAVSFVGRPLLPLRPAGGEALSKLPALAHVRLEGLQDRLLGLPDRRV